MQITSSQIGQRKDIQHKNMPYNFNQSRAGDTTSQGGTTSATTAIGNQDINHENRSGLSGHENIHYIGSNGQNHSPNNNNVGDVSNKSMSDHQRTPKNKELEQDQYYKVPEEAGVTSQDGK